MSKKAVTIILTLAVLFGFSSLAVAETKVTLLPGISKPGQQVSIDKDRMYLVEDVTIYIYSLEDFKLIKKFGKRGEGPREFMSSIQRGPSGLLTIDVAGENLLVKSLGKLSWYTKEGNYIKELKPQGATIYTAIQFEKNVVLQKLVIGNVLQQALTVVNEKLETIKELDRLVDAFQFGKGLMVLKNNPLQAVYDGKLFAAWKNDVVIKVYDQQLNELYTIKHDIKRVKVSADVKKKIVHFLKTSPQFKNIYNVIKPITFPELYPAIAGMSISGGKIYITTFKADDPKDDIQMSEILIFDLKGKLLETVMFPLKMSSPIIPYPFAVHSGKFYQIVENIDDEEWEVHITDLADVK
ncbi:MAG: hypothetical protein GY940_46175 [bacterium]|nr:hypothetical protein [bacterium]